MEEVVAVTTHVAPVILRSWVARASFSLDDLDELFCGGPVRSSSVAPPV